MGDEKKNDEPEIEEVEGTPDPGPPDATPRVTPRTDLSPEEQAEKDQKDKEEAEEAARKAADDQPEDPSVEEKARAAVIVPKEQFEKNWPTQQERFPGIEPEFGKEKDGYVELLNVQAPAMAYATGCDQPVEVATKPGREQHGWSDFVDNSLPPSDEEEGDIEAKPKRRKQQKVAAGSGS